MCAMHEHLVAGTIEVLGFAVLCTSVYDHATSIRARCRLSAYVGVYTHISTEQRTYSYGSP